MKQILPDYLMDISFFCHEQWGFLPGRSTVEAVRSIVTDIVEGLENGQHVSLSLYDISRAFDCVSHHLLIKKLSLLGLSKNLLSFFRSYFTDRCQKVNLNGCVSKALPLRHGVPQGSVLGPLLFLVYINDFPQFIKPSSCVLFADDTTIISKSASLQSLDQSCIHAEYRAQTWFAANFLRLNHEKTQKLLISCSNVVTHGSGVTLLGVTIDDRLNWSPHIESLSKKLSSVIFVLRRLRNSIDFDVLRNVYFALYHSKMQYGIALWGGSTDAIRVFRLQKKAIRIMLNLGYRESCKRYFPDLQIMTLPSTFIYSSLVEIHKNRANYLMQSDIHSKSTRYAHHLRTPQYRLNKSVRNTLNLNLYNVLPRFITNLTEDPFKRTLKRILIENCFYSTDDFLHHRF